MTKQNAFPPAAGAIAAVLIPFAAGYFLSYLSRSVNGPLSDLLIAEFHLDAGALGLVTSVYFLAFTAAQLPFGLLVDRYGPKRTHAVVLMFAVFGALRFATAQDVQALVLGRALIGLGTAGALMAGLKSIAIWLPGNRRPLANGVLIMTGGLGAMASTVPVDLALPSFGWRGVFFLLAGALALTVAMVVFIVPDDRAAAKAEHWQENLRSLKVVYCDPAFWRLAPLSAMVIGTAFAMHGLWAARWLRDVDRFLPAEIALDLAIMGAGLAIGAAVIGVVIGQLRRLGVPTIVTFGCCCAVFIGLQLSALCRLPIPAWLLWGAIGSFGSMTVLSFSILGEMFAPERIGRANSALNVLHLFMAFVIQYGMGIIASHWTPDSSGRLPQAAYQAAFYLPLSLEILALLWFARSAVATARIKPLPSQATC